MASEKFRGAELDLDNWKPRYHSPWVIDPKKGTHCPGVPWLRHCWADLSAVSCLRMTFDGMTRWVELSFFTKVTMKHFPKFCVAS